VKRIETASELVVQQAFEEGPGELSSQNPMVLSCGGIYIPYNKRKLRDKPLWKVLNLPDNERLSKVVSSSLPQSPLCDMLKKESMN